MALISRILWDNKVMPSTSVLTALSEQTGFEAIRLQDQGRGIRHRSKLGWNIGAGFNDEFLFTVDAGNLIAHVAPGNYSTGASMATGLQTAINAAGYNPTAFNVKCWLRADSVNVSAAGLVTQLTDLSGNGFHATQASAGLQATHVANAVDGRPGLYFPGDAARGYSTSALMSAMLAATTGRGTVVCVFKLDSDASANDTFWWAGSAGHFMQQYWSGGVNFAANVYTGADVIATKAAALGVNAWQHAWYEYDGSNVTSFVSNANTANGTAAAQTGNVHADILNSTLFIGQSAILKGYLLELMVFPSALNETARRGIVQYLKGRYPSMAANDATTATVLVTGTASYSSTTKQFTVTNTTGGATVFSIPALTGSPALDRGAAIYKDIGFTLTDKTGALTYTAENAAYQSRHWIKVDLGSALAITSAAALDHNSGASGGTFTLQGNAIDLWVAPTQAQALTGDAAERSAYFGSSSLRWLRLLVDDVQNTLGYSELAILFAGPYLQPPYPYSDAYKPGSNPLSQRSYSGFGALHLDQRPRQRKWDVTYDTMDQATVDLFEAMEQVTPPGRAFFFLFDSTAPTGIRYVELQQAIEYQPVPPYYFHVAMPIQEVLA